MKTDPPARLLLVRRDNELGAITARGAWLLELGGESMMLRSKIDVGGGGVDTVRLETTHNRGNTRRILF